MGTRHISTRAPDLGHTATLSEAPGQTQFWPARSGPRFDRQGVATDQGSRRERRAQHDCDRRGPVGDCAGSREHLEAVDGLGRAELRRVDGAWHSARCSHRRVGGAIHGWLTHSSRQRCIKGWRPNRSCVGRGRRSTPWDTPGRPATATGHNSTMSAVDSRSAGAAAASCGGPTGSLRRAGLCVAKGSWRRSTVPSGA